MLKLDMISPRHSNKHASAEKTQLAVRMMSPIFIHPAQQENVLFYTKYFTLLCITAAVLIFLAVWTRHYRAFKKSFRGHVCTAMGVLKRGGFSVYNPYSGVYQEWARTNLRAIMLACRLERLAAVNLTDLSMSPCGAPDPRKNPARKFLPPLLLYCLLSRTPAHPKKPTNPHPRPMSKKKGKEARTDHAAMSKYFYSRQQRRQQSNLVFMYVHKAFRNHSIAWRSIA